MRTTFLKAAFGLTGLAGVFFLATALPAAEPATASLNATTPGGSGMGTPVIQFETNFFDFGKLIAPGAVAGVFKFKNAGEGVLQVDPPHPSCGCTVAKVIPDTLVPGEHGEIDYTVNLDHAMQGVQKHIMVHSNDPQTPDVRLTMQMDYSPLYVFNPTLLQLQLLAGKSDTERSVQVTRTDGKPVDIERLTGSQPWVSAVADPAFQPGTNAAQVNVTIHRPASPSAVLSASVQLWTADETDRPMQTLLTLCQVQGALSVAPTRMYWVIPNFGDSITNYPDVALSRKLTLTSISGQPVKLGKVSVGIQGMSAQTVPKEGGKAYDLILKFNELPAGFTNSTLTVDTDPPSLPKLEVPVTISVAPR